MPATSRALRSRSTVARPPETDLDTVAAETGFSGVVWADGLARAYGLADRSHHIPNRVDTQFAIASGTKGLTALAVVALIEEGRLELATTARAFLGDDLPLIGAEVTVEQLLSHRSGIGDYYDEDRDLDFDDYLSPVPVHELGTTDQYVAALDGYPPKFASGERFAYCNSGFVVLAVIAERASGVPFHDLVLERVCAPAQMTDTAFLRSDDLPDRAARGYLRVDGRWRSNVFHVPVRGHGDGGIYTTAHDVAALWEAFFAGRIVSPSWVAEMTRPRSELYGLGFWLREPSGTVTLEGRDTGVLFRSDHDPAGGSTRTLLSNTSEGAREMWRALNRR